MEPIFTHDAVILGLLLVVIAFIFWTESLDNKFSNKFYTYVPSLLLMYFVPALLNWPLGLIAPEWFDNSIIDLLNKYNLSVEGSPSFLELRKELDAAGVPAEEYMAYHRHSSLYYVASRFLLPASLVLLCLGIDFKGILRLGPKALIMFFTATIGIIIGGPLALLIINAINPDMIGMNTEDLWRGLSTVAGSWIGGGANQTAMKEIFEVKDNIFASMIVVDVIVANIWMGVLLYGAGISDKVDKRLKADNSAIKELIVRMKNFKDANRKFPRTKDLFVILAIAFGATAIAHWGADIISPFFESKEEFLNKYGLNSLISRFFWLIVIATTIGLALSFTKARKVEGYGASNWGSVFIYILVATIGMKMDILQVMSNLELFSIGLIWMTVHVVLLLLVAKLIKAPFFFVAVGSQANIGGAASAPIVASAFAPSLAPVGALMAVLGYALGTYGALICAYMMSAAVG